MIVARYKETPEGQFDVEMFVLLPNKGQTVKIAEFTCKDEKELKESTENADYVLKEGDVE